MASELRQLYEVFPSDSRSLVPLGIRADGAIFAQGLSAADPTSGVVAGTLKEQAQACFARMRELVQNGGGSLDNVARVTAYVLSAEDREPLYALWDALFPRPDDRPAFKVLTGPLPPGRRIQLDVIAVPGARRKRIDIANVEARDPTVVIGDWLFTSRLHGLSPATGRPLAGLQPQLSQAIANARTLLELAGGDRQLVQLTTFGLGSSYRDGAHAALEAAVKAEARPPARNVLHSWVRPGTEAMVEAVALARSNGHDFRELFLAPMHSNQAAGLKYGRLVFAGGLAPIDARGELVTGGGVEAQLRAVLTNMDRLMADAGCGRADVARASFYLRDLNDRPVLNSVWQEWFPDPQDRPPHTYMPAALPVGQDVALQLIALAGATRKVLSVAGVEHGDPMSLGAVVGNLLVSSRIFGSATSSNTDTPEEHVAKCFETAAALLSAGGTDWRNVSQLCAYASSPEFRGPVQRLLSQILPQAESARLDFLQTDLGRRTLLPRLQLLAVKHVKEPDDTKG